MARAARAPPAARGDALGTAPSPNTRPRLAPKREDESRYGSASAGEESDESSPSTTRRWPIEILPPNTAAATLQAAIERALQTSAANADNDAPPKGWKTPLLKRAGVRSYKEFMRGATVCFIFEDNGVFDVERWQAARDGRGFEPAPRRSERLTGASRLAESVLHALDVA